MNRRGFLKKLGALAAGVSWLGLPIPKALLPELYIFRLSTNRPMLNFKIREMPGERAYTQKTW